MKTNPSDITVPGIGSLARAPVRNKSQLVVPADDAGERFLEFFAATIRNSNTRTAYLRSVGDFLTWGDIPNLTSLREIRPLHVAAYIEECGGRVAAPTVKLRLAALRSLFDWLVRTGVMDNNPCGGERRQLAWLRRWAIIRFAEQASRPFC